jgi:hypothetical protein
LVSR